MQTAKKLAYGVANGLVLLAPAIVSAQAEPGKPLSGGNWAGRGAENSRAAGLPNATIYDIISATLSWLLGILGFIAVIGFVISGILYLTAAGNESQLEKAKSAMTYSIVGVIVALMGYVILQAVQSWLGSNSEF